MKKNPNFGVGPAFPLSMPNFHEAVDHAGFESTDWTMGMNLRDYFAAQVLNGVSFNVHGSDENKAFSCKYIAQFCYLMADAMLIAREKTNDDAA